MSARSSRGVAIGFLLAAPLFAQQTPSVVPAEDPKHDISMVDQAPLGGTIAVTLPENQRKQLQKYEIPELAGSKQAIGSQLIDGRLPKPLVDYIASSGGTEQRISLFEGGLIVLKITGAGGTMFKRLLLPDDAMKVYLRNASPAMLRNIRPTDVPFPSPGRKALIRVYDADGKYVQRDFDPLRALPKPLSDEVVPLEDLLRAMSEDRTVTTSLANYEPALGDQLVADDHRVYRVKRILPEGNIVELECTSMPTKIYVAKKDLANYFVGKR